MSRLQGPMFVRLGWLVTTVAMAAALVGGAALNYRGARASVTTLNRGQADLLERQVRTLGRPGETPTSEQLDSLVVAQAGAGLKYLAILDTVGATVVEAGDRAGDIVFDPPVGGSGGPPPPVFMQARDRVRVFFPRPPGRTFGQGQQQAGGAQGGRGQQAGGQRRGPSRDYWQVVEFEPIAAGLVSDATRTLVVSASGALLLTLAALLFWRASIGNETAQRKLEEQRRLAVLGGMSAVLAHEIRNPLASLKGNVQLLAERMPEGTKERARADRAVSEAERLEALTSDLLDFARSGPIEMKPTDPSQVLRQAAEDVGGGVELSLAGAPPVWVLDASRLRQALGNLLDNARQSAPAPRVPVASVAKSDGHLVFEVRDFGPGLSDGTDGRIFEPFFTTRTQGTGLGLAVARRVTEMHGGAITAANHPDGGAVFRIALPMPPRGA